MSGGNESGISSVDLDKPNPSPDDSRRPTAVSSPDIVLKLNEHLSRRSELKELMNSVCDRLTDLSKESRESGKSKQVTTEKPGSKKSQDDLDTAGQFADSLMGELTSWLRLIEEVADQRAEGIRAEKQQEDAEYLSRIKHNAGLYEASISGHREALNDALVQKANWRAQCECAERVIADVYDVARKIDSSWRESATSQLRTLKDDYDQRLDQARGSS